MAEKNLRLRVVLDLADKALAPLKRISQGSKDTAATLKAARDQLKQLEATQKAVGQFRETRTGLTETETKLKAARERVKQLALQFNQVGVPTKAMTAAMATARTEANKLGAQFNAQQQKVQQLRDKLHTAGISTKNLADHDRQLRASIAATRTDIERQTSALKKQTDQHRKLEEIRKQAAKGAAIGAGMSAAGAASMYAGRQALRPVQGAMGAFSEQENASSQLSASMMMADGSVSKEFAQIDALAKRLGDRLPGTTADFLELMAVLKQQGLADKTILGGTGEAAALLGVQLRMNIPAAGEFAAKMQDATRTAESDMLGLMDTIQRSYYMGVDSSNMLQGFSKMSPVMSILRKEGLEFSNMMAPLLVMMDQTGMAGESAGNAIRKVFQGGLDMKKLGKANDLLKSSKAGFQLKFTDKNGAFLGLDNVFAQLDKLKGLGDNAVLRTGVLKALFGDDSETMQVLNTMMDKGKAGYAEIAAKMAAQASLQQRVEQQLGTFSNVVEAAQGSATNAIASIGEVMAPDLKNLVNWLGETGGKANDWIKENQTLVRWLGMGALALSAFLAVTGALLIPLGLVVAKTMALRWVFAKLGIGKGVVAVFKGLFNWGARLVPILVRFAPMLLRLLGPIGLLITAGWAVYSNWESICGGAKAMWQDFSTWFMGLMSGLGNWIAGLWNNITSMASAAMSAVMGEVRSIIDGGVASWIAAILNFSPLGILWGIFTNALAMLGVQVPQQFRSFGSFIMDGLIGGITGKLAALKDTVVGAAESIAKWFSFELKIKSPSRVFTQFGGWISEGAANGIAAGQAGVRAAALAMAGAAAAPVGAMDAGGAISSGPALAPRTGAAVATAPSSYNITINAAPGMDAQAIARAVAAELDKRERQNASRGRSALHDRS